MTKEEAKEIITMVMGAYPRLDLDEEKISVWFRFLIDKDYKTCLRNLIYHIENNPFPPSIADVLNNSELSKKDWERKRKLSELKEIERNKWVNDRGTLDGFENYWQQRKSEL